MSEKRPPIELEVHIGPDGEIVFTEAPEDIVEIVKNLDPDHPLSCRLAPPKKNALESKDTD